MVEQATKTNETSAQQAEKDRQRSPSYPSVSLDEAIEKARSIWDQDKAAAGTLEVIAAHLGSSPKSSGFLQSISSMIRYGLLSELEGKPRRLKLTTTAVNILVLPEGDPKRTAAIREAALTPAVFKDLWESHGTDLPSDANLVVDLMTNGRFSHNAAVDLIKQYRKTLAFANLGSCDKSEVAEERVSLKVGDWIQWVSQGVAQFPEPRRVTGISSDGGFLFVAESPTGIPADQANRVDPPAGKQEMLSNAGDNQSGDRVPPVNPNYKPPAPPSDARQYSLTTDTGDVVVRWPSVLSGEDYETVESWLDGLKKKIKRSVKPGEGDSEN